MDDWFGQNVARDQEFADELVAEEDGDLAAAERRFDGEADGEGDLQGRPPRPES